MGIPFLSRVVHTKLLSTLQILGTAFQDECCRQKSPEYSVVFPLLAAEGDDARPMRDTVVVDGGMFCNAVSQACLLYPNQYPQMKLGGNHRIICKVVDRFVQYFHDRKYKLIFVFDELRPLEKFNTRLERRSNSLKASLRCLKDDPQSTTCPDLSNFRPLLLLPYVVSSFLAQREGVRMYANSSGADADELTGAFGSQPSTYALISGDSDMVLLQNGSLVLVKPYCQLFRVLDDGIEWYFSSENCSFIPSSLQSFSEYLIRCLIPNSRLNAERYDSFRQKLSTIAQLRGFASCLGCLLGNDYIDAETARRWSKVFYLRNVKVLAHYNVGRIEYFVGPGVPDPSTRFSAIGKVLCAWWSTLEYEQTLCVGSTFVEFLDTKAAKMEETDRGALKFSFASYQVRDDVSSVQFLCRPLFPDVSFGMDGDAFQISATLPLALNSHVFSSLRLHRWHCLWPVVALWLGIPPAQKVSVREFVTEWDASALSLDGKDREEKTLRTVFSGWPSRLAPVPMEYRFLSMFISPKALLRAKPVVIACCDSISSSPWDMIVVAAVVLAKSVDIFRQDRLEILSPQHMNDFLMDLARVLCASEAIDATSMPTATVSPSSIRQCYTVCGLLYHVVLAALSIWNDVDCVHLFVRGLNAVNFSWFSAMPSSISLLCALCPPPSEGVLMTRAILNAIDDSLDTT
eukprot:ANDGO_04263.mRNA.1 hypothetical protein